jgi:hypothetical protein
MRSIGLLPQKKSPLTVTEYTQRTNLQRAFFRTDEMSKGFAFPSFAGIITVRRTWLSAETIVKLPAASYGECARSWIQPRCSPWTSVTSAVSMRRSRLQRLSTVRAAAEPLLLSIVKREDVLSTRTFPAGIKSRTRKKGSIAFRNDDPFDSRSPDIVIEQRKAAALERNPR